MKWCKSAWMVGLPESICKLLNIESYEKVIPDSAGRRIIINRGNCYYVRTKKANSTK
ncbi:hypothetical protein HMPREF9996_02306, partial [Aggregatibacter actinomycetemcomitans Y4]